MWNWGALAAGKGGGAAARTPVNCVRAQRTVNREFVVMRASNAEILRPVTIGHIRNRGCHELLVRCNSPSCGHSSTVAANQWTDDTIVESLGPFFECSRCGNVGADVSPNWALRAASHHGLAKKSGKESTFRS